MSIRCRPLDTADLPAPGGTGSLHPVPLSGAKTEPEFASSAVVLESPDFPGETHCPVSPWTPTSTHNECDGACTKNLTINHVVSRPGEVITTTVVLGEEASPRHRPTETLCPTPGSSACPGRQAWGRMAAKGRPMDMAD